MEKTKNTLKELTDLLNTIKIEAGEKKADCRDTVQNLEVQVEKFVKAATAAGLGDPDHHEQDLFPSADTRTAEFEEDIRLRAEYPESLFPMAADTLCWQVGEWFRRRYLLYAKDVQLGRVLHVEVSGSLFGSHTSLSDTPVTAKKQYEAKVEKLREHGWVYKKRYGSLKVVDCPTNLTNIHKIIIQMGGYMPRIELRDGFVQSFSFSIPGDKCKDLFQSMSCKEEKEEKVVSETVTEDEAAVIQRNLKDSLSVNGSLSYMNDWSIPFSLLRSHTGIIEEVLGFMDMDCAKRLKERHAEEARKNRGLRDRQDEIGREALDSLDLRTVCNKIEDGLQKVFCPMGLYVEDMKSSQYATTRFCVTPRILYHSHRPELRSDLDFVPQPGDRMMYLRNNPDNIDRLIAAVKETMPGAKVDSLTAAVADIGHIVKKIYFTISSADIALMLEKTKDMAAVDPF